MIDPDPLAEVRDAAPPVSERVARSVVGLASQFGALTALSALNTIAITRLLGPTGYGVYGTAVAAWAVLGAVSGFGFSMMLSRDAGSDPSRYRPMLRAAYAVAGWWSLALTGAMVVMALVAPIGSQRGLALLVLAPSMLFNGLNPAKTFFLVTFRTARLVQIDVACMLLQVLGSIAVSAAGAGPVAVCAVVSAGSIIDNVIVSLVAERMLPAGQGHFSRRELIRRSAPLGAISIMTKVYLTIDLVLLGWYVRGPRLGDYAAASKLLTVLAGLAGAVMAGALPALASSAPVRADIDALSGRVWHWLMSAAIPMFIALALFAPLVVDASIGHRYARAVPLIRILCIAGGVSVISNLVGNLMVALHRTSLLFIQNSAAIALNVAGNVILIPTYGVYAAAWMTVATELLVCAASIVSLRRDISLAPLLAISVRPALAAAVAAVVALLLISSQILAVCGALAIFVAAMSALRAWPPELHLRMWRAPRVRGS
jgi:O-antigen/teichoic acid export membrane protein